MKIVIQRVSRASVSENQKVVGSIGLGLLVLVGVTHNDTQEDLEWLVKKTIALRIFSDDQGLMNLDITQVKGSFLVVSQFTLHASTKKGNRPSFIHSADPKIAEEFYETFCSRLATDSGLTVERGVFGANMEVELVNSGPVTILIDSKDKI
ncbi:MAG: D-aminoacyl-tRNA deacylase [Luteibaculaceae bacterium]